MECLHGCDCINGNCSSLCTRRQQEIYITITGHRCMKVNNGAGRCVPAAQTVELPLLVDAFPSALISEEVTDNLPTNLTMTPNIVNNGYTA